MSEEIIKVLDHIGEKFGIAVDWTSENIMPYFNELCGKIIKYEICTSVILAVVFALAMVLCVIFGLKCFRKMYDENDDFFELWIAGLIFSIIALIFVLVGFLQQILDIVTCCVFPEKYLFEYFTKFLRGI